MFVLFLCAVVLQVTEAVGRLLYELFAVHRHLDIIVCLPKYLCFNVVALQYYVDHPGYFGSLPSMRVLFSLESTLSIKMVEEGVAIVRLRTVNIV